MVLQRFHLSRFHQFLYFIPKRFLLTNSTEMQNAYINHELDSERFSFTFHYVNDSLGVDRQFNLQRLASEPISTFLGRIQCNVEKIVNAKHAKRLKKSAKRKKSDGDETDLEPVPQITVELLQCGNPVPGDKTCHSILQSRDLLMLSLSGKKFHIIVNPPWVDEIQLPKSILSNFPAYPSKLSGRNFDRQESVFLWFKRLKNSADWEEVGSGYIYTPSAADIHHILKVTCQPKKGASCGPIVEAVSGSPIEAGPGECPFELRHTFTRERAIGDCFRVLSYNILAGMYSDTDAAKNELFAHCPTYALDIDYRKQLIVKEILGYKSDIMCLQEVDERVFANDLEPILSLESYEGVFHNKGSVREGLACLFNTVRFRLISTEQSLLSSELSERPCYEGIWETVKENVALLERLKDRGTISQATVLQSMDDPKKLIVVGNTHLFFHPDADHIRLVQAGQTILFLDEVVRKVKEKNPSADVSLIFCGDFNSTPDCGVYRLMTTGQAPENLIDWKSNENEKISGLSLSQPFKLASACGTPPFTNYTVGFTGCLDYIFYQTDSMLVKQVIPFYSEEEVKRYTALPNVVFPSDHIALVSDLQWSS